MYVVVHPASPSAATTAAILNAGYQPIPVDDLSEAGDKEPADGWMCGIVELGADPNRAITFAAKLREEYQVAVLLIVDRTLTQDLAGEAGFDDFILTPIDAAELRIRMARLGVGVAETLDDHTLHFRDLELNTATYQATMGGHPTDLTYMEYELLRFLVEHPKRVWSREQILSKVWGYDYFGGSRTVDVHIRRLRAKLGEERASWITTVRSVGYRFG